MKTLKYIFSLSIALLFCLGCAEDDNDLSFVDSVVAPSDISADFNILQDNSGLVTITPNAIGGVSYSRNCLLVMVRLRGSHVRDTVREHRTDLCRRRI